MDTRGDPLAPFDEGMRVSLRHRLDDGRATDVVGLIDGLDRTSVRLVDRHDQAHVVDRAAVLVVRAVPVSRGPDPQRADARTLERIAAQSWHDEIEPLGEWWLRYAGGATNRANSCLAVGDPGLPVAAAASAIISHAQRHDLPPQAQVIVGSSEEQSLCELGWRAVRTDVTVLTARLVSLCGTDPGTIPVSDQLDAAWFDRYRNDHPSTADGDQLRRLMLSGRTVFAGLRIGGGLVGIGRASLDQDWLTLFGLWTDPAHRRRGLMRDLVRSLGWWAAARGARSVQLQVDTANTVALAAYDRLGFSHHHDYRYLIAPD